MCVCVCVCFWILCLIFLVFGTGEKWRIFCYMELYMLRSMKWIILKVEVEAFSERYKRFVRSRVSLLISVDGSRLIEFFLLISVLNLDPIYALWVLFFSFLYSAFVVSFLS